MWFNSMPFGSTFSRPSVSAADALLRIFRLTPSCEAPCTEASLCIDNLHTLTGVPQPLFLVLKKSNIKTFKFLYKQQFNMLNCYVF